MMNKLEYVSESWEDQYCSLPQKIMQQTKIYLSIHFQWGRDQWKASYSALNWQTLESRRKIIKLKVCYNILNHYSPLVLLPILTHLSQLCPHNKTLFVPYTRTLSHKSHFLINIVPACNSLPAYIVKTALHPVLLSRVLLLIL